MAMYEITWIDLPNRTEIWCERRCRREFGTKEWEEIKAGYLPHIIAIKLTI